MSLSKNDLMMHISQLINGVFTYKDQKFKLLKQSKLRSLNLEGTGINPPESTKEEFSFTGLFQKIVSSEQYDVMEADVLWQEINIILNNLETDLKSTSKEFQDKELELLSKQKILLENALLALGPKNERADTIDKELASFENNKERQFRVQKNEALKLFKELNEKLQKPEGKLFLIKNSNSSNKWNEIKSIFQQTVSKGSKQINKQDYVDLINLVWQLENLKKDCEVISTSALQVKEGNLTKKSAQATDSNQQQINRKKKKSVPFATIEEKNILQEIDTEKTFIENKNQELFTQLHYNLKFLRHFESTKWKELNLTSFKKNNAFSELETFCNQLEGVEKSNLKEFFAEIGESIVQEIQELKGEEVSEAIALKNKVDEHLDQLESNIVVLVEEINKINPSSDHLNQMKLKSSLLEKQNLLLKETIKKIDPIINDINLIDKKLSDFKTNKRLYKENQSEFNGLYQTFLVEIKEIENKLNLELNNNNGPAIEELKKNLKKISDQFNEANQKIQSKQEDPNLRDFSYLLSSIYDFKESLQESKTIIEKIEGKIPDQLKENQLREKYTLYREMLLISYELLGSKKFDAAKIQKEALNVLTNKEAGEFLYEDNLKYANSELLQQRIDSMEIRVEILNEFLNKNLNFNFNESRLDLASTEKNPQTALEILKELELSSDGRAREYFIEYRKLNEFTKVLNEQDYICEFNLEQFLAENKNWNEDTNKKLIPIRIRPPKELFAYCKKILQFNDIMFDSSDETKKLLSNIEHYEKALDFNFEGEFNKADPMSLSRQLESYLTYVSSSDYRNEEINRILNNKDTVNSKLKEQYPSLNPKLVMDTQFNFEKNLTGLNDKDKEILKQFVEMQERGDFKKFLNNQLDAYNGLQAKISLAEFDTNSASNLRSTHDFIARAYKLHYLSIIHGYIEAEKKVNDSTSKDATDAWETLKKEVNSLPLHQFLNETKANGLKNKLLNLQKQHTYYTFLRFNQLQEKLLEKTASSDTAFSNDYEQETLKIQEKIKSNIAEKQKINLRSMLPAYDLIIKNKWLLLNNNEEVFELNNLKSNFSNEEIIELEKQVSKLASLEAEINKIVFTEPTTNRECFKLLSQFRECEDKIKEFIKIEDSWKKIDSNRLQFIDSILKKYPDESNSNSNGFFAKGNQWKKIIDKLSSNYEKHKQNLLNSDELTRTLNKYQHLRNVLIKAKNAGFDPNINYNDLILEINSLRVILNDAQKNYNDLIDQSKNEIQAEMSAKLTKASLKLSQFNKQMKSKIEQDTDLTSNQKQKLETLLKSFEEQLILVNQNSNHIQTLGEGEVIIRADQFLETLSQFKPIDQNFYNDFNEEGKSLLDVFYEWCFELAKDWGLIDAFAMLPLNDKTQEYKKILEDQIKEITDSTQDNQTTVKLS